MPIRPYLGSRVFEPELVREMGEAFEMVCRALSLKPEKQDPATIRVAEAVVVAAEEGAVEAEVLFEGAMLSLVAVKDLEAYASRDTLQPE